MHLFALYCIRDACGGVNSGRLVVNYSSLMQQEMPTRDTSPEGAVSDMRGEGREMLLLTDKQTETRGLRRVKRPGFDRLRIAIATAE
jgi:hypothetical protein